MHRLDSSYSLNDFEVFLLRQQIDRRCDRITTQLLQLSMTVTCIFLLKLSLDPDYRESSVSPQSDLIYLSRPLPQWRLGKGGGGRPGDFPPYGSILRTGVAFGGEKSRESKCGDFFLPETSSPINQRPFPRPSFSFILFLVPKFLQIAKELTKQRRMTTGGRTSETETSRGKQPSLAMTQKPGSGSGTSV